MLQVNISWEDILQEDHNKGIFDMELEEWEENTDNIAKDSIKVCFIIKELAEFSLHFFFWGGGGGYTRYVNLFSEL